MRSWKVKSSEVETKSQAIISNTEEIEEIVEKVIVDKLNSKAISDFKSGNKATLNFLIGQVMKLSNKRADYALAKKLLEKKLK